MRGNSGKGESSPKSTSVLVTAPGGALKTPDTVLATDGKLQLFLRGSSGPEVLPLSGAVVGVRMRALGALREGVGQGGPGWGRVGPRQSWLLVPPFPWQPAVRHSETLQMQPLSSHLPQGRGLQATCGKWLSVLKGGQGLPLESPHFRWALPCFLHPSMGQWVAPGM